MPENNGIIKVDATYNPDKPDMRSMSVEYDFGGDLTTAEDRFGEEVVFNNFVAQAKINLQSALRRWMKPDGEGNSKTDEEIATLVSEWEPSAKVLKKKSNVDKAKALLGKLSDEQRAELLQAMRG